MKKSVCNGKSAMFSLGWYCYECTAFVQWLKVFLRKPGRTDILGKVKVKHYWKKRMFEAIRVDLT